MVNDRVNHRTQSDDLWCDSPPANCKGREDSALLTLTYMN